MFKLNYKWITTPEMRARLEEHQRAHIEDFRQFVLRRRDKSVTAEAFRAWWISRGPTGFTNFEDSRRYREELWHAICKGDSGKPVN